MDDRKIVSGVSGDKDDFELFESGGCVARAIMDRDGSRARARDATEIERETQPEGLYSVYTRVYRQPSLCCRCADVFLHYGKAARDRVVGKRV